MTLHVNAFVSIMLLSAATTAHAQSPNRTLAVYVTAAAADPGDDADPQRKATLDDARNALKALECSVKAAHGDRRERWPAEVEERYRIAAAGSSPERSPRPSSISSSRRSTTG